MLEFSFGGRLNGTRRDERDLGEKDKLWGIRARNNRKLGKKMILSASEILALIFWNFDIFSFLLKWCSSVAANMDVVWTLRWHGDKCRIGTSIRVEWHGQTLVLDGKMDGCTISVFFHSTGTSYEKNENWWGKK